MELMCIVHIPCMLNSLTKPITKQIMKFAQKKKFGQMQKKSVNWLCKENGQFTSRQLERKLDFFKNRIGLGHFIQTCIKMF